MIENVGYTIWWILVQSFLFSSSSSSSMMTTSWTYWEQQYQYQQSSSSPSPSSLPHIIDNIPVVNIQQHTSQSIVSYYNQHMVQIGVVDHYYYKIYGHASNF